jgi:hypothetical protein
LSLNLDKISVVPSPVESQFLMKWSCWFTSGCPPMVPWNALGEGHSRWSQPTPRYKRLVNQQSIDHDIYIYDNAIV